MMSQRFWGKTSREAHGFTPVQRSAPRTGCTLVESRRAGMSKAFTLVELLVVIGIIAVLIAIIMPSLSRAREQAKQIQCLSNVRQIGMGFYMYAGDNKGIYPRFADWGGEYPEDWIYWENDRDPAQSAIALYVGGFTAEKFRCPSDDLTRYPGHISGGYGPYLYSYSFNTYCSSTVHPAIRLGSIYNASEKILLVEEDQLSLDDGNWLPTFVGNPLENFLAIRHDRPLAAGEDDNNRRGNVALCDGHAEYVTRLYTRQGTPQYPTGENHWDPTVP